MKSRASVYLFRTLPVIWVLCNLFFLVSFPFVHSDEIWLSSLSRQIALEKNPGALEPFFDLYPRTAHGMRLLFSAMQAVFMRFFGFQIFSVRLLSLMTGAVCLILFYRLLKSSGFPKFLSVLVTFLLSVDSQFLYSAHFARQEIQLTAFMLLGLNIFLSSSLKPVIRGLFTGICTGTALLIHPNAFVTAWPVGLLFLFFVVTRRRTAAEAAAFAGSAAVVALIVLAVSLLINPDFLSGYREFGRSVGVREGWAEKAAAWPGFYFKLFHRISGTYYIPELRPQLILTAVLIPVSAAVLLSSAGKSKPYSAFRTDPVFMGLAGILGCNIGTMIIGKYSPLSFVFQIPFLYFLIAECLLFLRWKSGSAVRILSMSLCLFTAVVSVVSVYHDTKRETESFEELNERLREVIPSGSRTFGNLLWARAVLPENLLDVRNGALLKENRLTFQEYAESRGIHYIINMEEMDYINHSRPVWNLLYGNPYPWYAQMKTFIDDKCELIARIPGGGYGTRLTALRRTREWTVNVYRIRSDSSSR